MQGFHFSQNVHTTDGIFSLEKIDLSPQVICFNDSDIVSKCKINKIIEFQSDCVDIELENGTNFLCTFFVNLFEINKQNFVKAHSLVKGSVVQLINENSSVKNIKYLYNQKMINLEFEGLPSFYVNSVFCHNNESPSSYALYKKNLLSQKPFLIDNLHRIINPNFDRNKNINILWKSQKFDKWRKAFYLSDGDFGKNSSGYSFGSNNSLEIQISKYSLISDKLIFYGRGSGVICKNSNNCIIKIHENLGTFLVLIENFQDESLVFEFNSQKECVLTNSLFVSDYETDHVRNIFQN